MIVYIVKITWNTYTRRDREKKNRVCVSGSACPAYVGIRCSLYYMSRFSRVDEPDSHDIPDKAAARSPVRPIGTFIIYPSSAFASAHFSRLLNRAQYLPTTYLPILCRAEKRERCAVARCSIQPFNERSGVACCLHGDGRTSRNISDSGIDETEKWGAQRKRHKERFQYDGAFAFNAFLYSFLSSSSLWLFTTRLHNGNCVCVCVRPVDDESATPENIYTYMYISVYIEHINSIFDARVVEQ